MSSSTKFDTSTKPTEGCAEQDEVDFKAIKRKSVKGGMVTLLTQGCNILLQLISTVVLARLLSPKDYGVIAMVTAVTSFANLFRDLGLSSAAIQKKNLTRDQQSNLFWINVAMGTILMLFVGAASPLIAWFYKKPELIAVSVALSSTFLIRSIGTQHGAMLVRNMQFGRQAVATITGTVVGMVVSIVFALRGLSYWALVWGTIIGAGTTTFLLFLLSPFWPGFISKGTGLREMVKFGANVTAFGFVNYFSRNLDNLLIGKFSGPAALGIYSKAYSLLMLPISSIRSPINAVAFPALCKLQHDPQSFREYYRESVNFIAWLSMPLTAFMWLASPELIDVLLGREWALVSPLFSWLAIAAFIQPASGFVGSVLMSLGQGRRYLGTAIINSSVIAVGFLIGIQWGAMGVAISYAVSNYILIYPWYTYALREAPVNLGDFLRACSVPAFVSIGTAAICWIIRTQVSIGSSITGLVIIGILFSVVLLGLTCAFTRPREEAAKMFAGLGRILKR